MDQLVEGVLPVGSWLTPINRTRLVVDFSPIQRDVFTVALHGQLLQVSGESLEVLFVGKHSNGLRAKEIVVPDSKHSYEHRQVLFERGGAEVLIHLVKTVQHGAEVFRADG